MEQYYADLSRRLHSTDFAELTENCRFDRIEELYSNLKDKNYYTDFKMKGNTFYSENNYRMALISYNKALCSAENGSEDVGIIFANRSAVALKTKSYTDCLKNIQLARQHNCPMKILVKLNEREKNCLELISTKKTPKKKAETLIDLLYGPTMEPFMIDCLEIVHKTNEKPFVISNRDLKVGEKIAVQNPFVGILLGNSLFIQCSNCMKKCPFDMIPCGGCRFAMFCSERCMNSALEFHKYECGINYKSLESDFEEVFSVTNCRGLFKALALFNGSVEELKQYVEESNELLTLDNCNGINEKSFLKSFNSLNFGTSKKLMFEFVLTMYPKIRSMLVNPELRIFLTSFFLKLSTTIVIRSTDHEYEKNGGFYPLPTALTLSCAPNVTNIVLSDSKIMYIVQHPIKAGAKLTIDNGVNYQVETRTERRETIFEKYEIKCVCLACEKNYPLMKKLKIISPYSYMDANLRFYMAQMITGIEALKMFKENSQLIHDNFDKNPCQEITLLMLANSALLLNYGHKNIKL